MKNWFELQEQMHHLHRVYDDTQTNSERKCNFQTELSILFYYIEAAKKSYLNSVNICFRLPVCPQFFYFFSFFRVGTVFVLHKVLITFFYLIHKEKTSNWTAHSGFHYYLTLRARQSTIFSIMCIERGEKKCLLLHRCVFRCWEFFFPITN